MSIKTQPILLPLTQHNQLDISFKQSFGKWNTSIIGSNAIIGHWCKNLRRRKFSEIPIVLCSEFEECVDEIEALVQKLWSRATLRPSCWGDFMKSDFKWKHFEGKVILLAVRWYLRYALTYRDLVEMLAERGLDLTHTTVMRWVHQYGSELDKRIQRHLRPTCDSWRVDESVPQQAA